MDNRPIGVFDSGLGGLTVVKELMNMMPKESIVYFGDTGRVPYGTRGSETIIKYSKQDINFLMTFDIKAIIIACGTASSVALPHIKDDYNIPIVGVVESTAVAAAKATKNKKIGILGTNGTINSRSYENKIKEIDSEIICVTNPCPLFVPLVENGYIDGDVASLVAKEYLQPLIENDVDTIILGCTHYPLLKKVISDIMGVGIKLIDCGTPTSRYVYNMLWENQLLSDSKPSYHYYVSDKADGFAHMGSMFLNREITNEIERINIEKY